MTQTTIPQGYKETKVGIIPNDWEVKQFDECFSQLKTNSLSREKLTYEHSENGVYNIHYGDIHAKFTKNILDIEKHKSVIPQIKNTEKEKFVFIKNGDLIMADASEDYDGVGQSIEIVNLGEKKLVSGLHTFALRPKFNFAEKYAGYIFSNFNTHKELKKIATGISVFGLSKSNISKIQLPIPPLPEQQAIANCLTTWDTAIEQQIKLIQAKKQHKKALMQRIFNDESRTKHWQEVKLGEVCTYKNGSSLENTIIENGKHNLITLNSIDINGKLKRKHHRTNFYDNSLQKGDLIMILSDVAHGNFLGISELIPNDNFVLNQRVGRLRIKDDNICNNYFLKVYINYNQSYYKRMGQGSSQKNLAKNDILKFKFKLPPLSEQEEIANVLSTADKEIALLEQQLTAMQQQKKGLMQVLLTGKKRLV